MNEVKTLCNVFQNEREWQVGTDVHVISYNNYALNMSSVILVQLNMGILVD